ncbi:MAG: GGDEF domain-containing protein [Desulfovibrio sp.]|jgi:diguanylate cyclase (GGDEF)-like protein|nr:GGDEF domain-containing protein [Desulfovibrio sp.]
MESMELYRDLMRLLDKAGVPLDTRWRSLLLYLREVKDYTHLSDVQKIAIQSLMTDVYMNRDYSEASLRHVLDSYHDCVVAPYKKKIEALLSEAESLVREFRGILHQRKESISTLEETTISIVEDIGCGADAALQVEKLHLAFSRIRDFLSNDLRNLENMATRDPLTGLLNRRGLDSFMAEAVRAWIDDNRPLALAIFDIDHFKNFNDNHGHRIGDQVLALVARQINEGAGAVSAGNKTVVARFGGEEFVLAVSGKGISQLYAVAETIRRNINQFNFLIRDADGNVLESGVQVTVSAGIAEMSPDWDSVYQENLLDCADKALYYAKNHGRDQVVAYRHNEKQTFARVSPEKQPHRPERLKADHQ